MCFAHNFISTVFSKLLLNWIMLLSHFVSSSVSIVFPLIDHFTCTLCSPIEMKSMKSLHMSMDIGNELSSTKQKKMAKIFDFNIYCHRVSNATDSIRRNLIRKSFGQHQFYLKRLKVKLRKMLFDRRHVTLEHSLWKYELKMRRQIIVLRKIWYLKQKTKSLLIKSLEN